MEKITKEFNVELTTKTPAKVSVTFPLYRKHDLLLDEADSVIYSRVDAELNEVSIQITETYRDGSERYALEFGKDRISGSDHSLGRAEYASNEDEFTAALRKVKDAIQKISEVE